LQVGQYEASQALAWRGMTVDPCAIAPLTIIMGYANTPEIAESYRQRMPYHLGLLQQITRQMCASNRDADALEAILRQMIDLAPAQEDAYYQLARVYLDRDDRPHAIDLIQQAYKNCEFSVGISNKIGEMVMWLVQEGRKEEALTWGRRGASTGSAEGMTGLVVALEANGRVEEAKGVYREIALRYYGSTNDYIRWLLKHDTPLPQMKEEVQALLVTHAGLQQSIADQVGVAFRQPGVDPQMLEELYKGPLAFQAPATQKAELLECAMFTRQFPRAVEYGMQAVELKSRNVYHLMWLHAAMRLSGKTERLRHVEDLLRNLPDKGYIAEHVAYVLGELDSKTLRQKCDSPYTRAYAYWLKGIDAEAHKQMEDAIEAYTTAVQCHASGDANWLSYYWAQMLSKQYPAATQAAGAVLQQSDQKKPDE
jgi:tetratricopeptide (TPR) repeat protein